MYKNSAMLKLALTVTALSLADVPAKAAGGGGDATPDQMPAICKAQAANQKLAAAAADAFIQKCTSASADSAARKSAARLEGTK
jgi:hypothetical protein